MDAREHFKGKKITVMGLGLLGRGVGDARYLAECGAELIVTDLKATEELASSVAVLKEFSNVTFVLGEHRLEDFRNRDFILKAAGVPLASPYVAEAVRNGIPVKMSASWFAEIAGIPVVGVTGTRGKSTVTHMLHAILEEAGHDVLLGGNIRGVSTLALLPQVQPESLALFELDSWQLQGFGDAKISPDIAVFTTFLEDHANYYQNDRDAYLADKANIFLYQKPSDTLILGSQCADLIEERYGDKIAAHTVVTGAHDFRSDWTLTVLGEHNRYDAALAVEAARALEVDDDVIEKALKEFPGIPGRLEFVRELNGVKFYNDTTATTPDATIAALEALAEGNTIRLILGGADKGLPVDALYPALLEYVQQCYLLAGTGTDRIKNDLPQASVFRSMDEAVTAAAEDAEAGDVVLLSPAFASFGLFQNEYDRGDQFILSVNSL
jgi:UDP-N-acetylmuramoylalanine--D-glutamate ligase